MNLPNQKKSESCTEHRGWETLFFFSEAVMIVFYCVGTTYDVGTHTYETNPEVIAKQNRDAQETMWTKYPMWQDIHVMMFIGYGFLMVFLKTHSWTSIGFNYLIAAWTIQCVIIF
jgi:ammonium transporter Rh